MDSFQALCYLVTCQHLIPISTVCFLKHSLFGFLGQPPLGFPVLTLHPSPDWLGPLEACMHTCSVIQSYLTLCDFMDYSPPGSSWDFPGKNTGVSCHFAPPDPGIQLASPLTLALAGRFFYHWATWETLGNIWCYSATESCPTLCHSMDCSMPGFPVFHHQTHVHWVNDAIQPSSVTLFSCLQSFLASGSFPMSQLFISGGQSTGASASVLLMNIQGWVPLGLTGLISLLSKGFSRVFSSTTVWKHQFFGSQPSLWSNSHIHTWLLEKPELLTTGKTIALTRWTFAGKVMSLLFNMLSRLVIAIFPRSKCLLISWLQSPSTLLLEPKKMKSDTISIVSPSICHEVTGPDATILVF